MTLSDLIRPLEELSTVDPISDTLQRGLRGVLDDRPLGAVLRGNWLGHAVHPVLVTIPIGACTCAIVFDRTGQSRAARRLLGIGLVSAPPALLTGWADWSTLNPQQRRVGLVHAFSNATGLGLLLASYRRRRTRSDRAARLLGALGAVVLGGGGALGGYLVYNQGARVEPLLRPSAGPQSDSVQLPDAREQPSRP